MRIRIRNTDLPVYTLLWLPVQTFWVFPSCENFCRFAHKKSDLLNEKPNLINKNIFIKKRTVGQFCVPVTLMEIENFYMKKFIAACLWTILKNKLKGSILKKKEKSISFSRKYLLFTFTPVYGKKIHTVFFP